MDEIDLPRLTDDQLKTVWLHSSRRYFELFEMMPQRHWPSTEFDDWMRRWEKTCDWHTRVCEEYRRRKKPTH